MREALTGFQVQNKTRRCDIKSKIFQNAAKVTIHKTSYRNWIWEPNSTNWLAGWLARCPAGREALLAGCAAGWPCATLAGRLAQKLDPEIGSRNWTFQFPIQLSEMGVPISDPIFRSNFLAHFAAEGCSKKLDQKIGSENWIIVFGALSDPISRSNFTIQFFDPIFSAQASRGAGLDDS